MKKFNVIYRDEKGELHERVFFAETVAEIKALKGFVAITSNTRVKHPSPEILQRVILAYQTEKKVPDLAEFYEACETLATEPEETEAVEPKEENKQ